VGRHRGRGRRGRRLPLRPPDDARRSIIAACNAIAQWYEPGGGTTPPELVERYTAIALRIVDHRG
jgi:hypothetical protein